MLVDIDKIVVGDRIRRDFGDIQELADDIRENGLINPPTINKNYVLLAGERRLRACKLLGWSQIEVHMLDTRDEEHDLAVELSENNMRRNFTGTELAAGIRRQMELESAKARERQTLGEALPEGSGGRARDKAGEHFGISGKQAEKVMFVDEHRDLLDPAEFSEWDEGKLSTNKAFQHIKARLAQAEHDRKVAELERDNATDALAESYRTNEVIESEVQSLRRQLAERPTEVREVPPQDYEATKKRMNDLKRDNERLNREYREVVQQNREYGRKLSQANEMLGERGKASAVQRDMEQFIDAVYSFLRTYAGRALATDQLDRVDDATQEELRKAMTNLAAFSQNLLRMVQDNK